MISIISVITSFLSFSSPSTSTQEMAEPTPAQDPEIYIHRNGQMIYNPAHFGSSNPLGKQAEARHLLDQVYVFPIEDQPVIAATLARDNEELAPYMVYEASKTGHAEVKKAIWESGMVAQGAGLNFDGVVDEYQTKRAKEVFAVGEDGEREEMVKKWLEEFDGEAHELMVSMV